MKKKMATTTRLGLNKRNLKRPTATSTTTKRVPKRGGFCVVEELLNYLKSDSFLYSTLLISSPSPSPPSEVTPRDENEIAGEELEEEYMKSDSYLYAPVLDLGAVNHPPTPPPTDTVEETGNQLVPLKTVSKAIMYSSSISSTHKSRGTPMAVTATGGYNLRRP